MDMKTIKNQLAQYDVVQKKAKAMLDIVNAEIDAIGLHNEPVDLDEDQSSVLNELDIAKRHLGGWASVALHDLLPIVEAAQALTIALGNNYNDPEWFFKYNSGLDSIACIACECFLGDKHEKNCPAKALDDALRALSDSSSQG